MEETLKKMVRSFRVSELKALLMFAGKSSTGLKSALQDKALELVASPPIENKIRELYVFSCIGLRTADHSLVNILSSTSFSDSSPINGRAPTVKNILKAVSPENQHHSFPEYVEVKFKPIPFHDNLDVVLKPTKLVNQALDSTKREANYQYLLSLSASQEKVITTSSGHKTDQNGTSKLYHRNLFQIFVRICEINFMEEQDDLFPSGLTVRVNETLVHSTPPEKIGVQRIAWPINISHSVMHTPFSSNRIAISWLLDDEKDFCLQIQLVKVSNTQDLLERLLNKDVKTSDSTKRLIKKLLEAEGTDFGTSAYAIPISVACPVGKTRMTYPCRSINCKHIQCFDAKVFLLMNERKLRFLCPVCDDSLKFEDLYIDGFFLNIIKTMKADDSNQIEVFSDGSWRLNMPVERNAKYLESSIPSKRLKIGNILLSNSKEETEVPIITTNLAVDDDIEIVAENLVNPKTSAIIQSGIIACEKKSEIVDLGDSSDNE